MSITKLDCMELKDTRYSVYPYDGYNLEEILGKFYEAIKECNDLSFSLQEFNTWLIDKGLLKEVEKQLSKVNWDNIVNSELYQKVLDELRKTNQEVEKIKEKLDLNIKDFGAKGDGITDDTNAIQSALDYIKTLQTSEKYSQGITLYFPDGLYIVSRGFEVNCSVHIKGSGVTINPSYRAFGDNAYRQGMRPNNCTIKFNEPKINTTMFKVKYADGTSENKQMGLDFYISDIALDGADGKVKATPDASITQKDFIIEFQGTNSNAIDLSNTGFIRGSDNVFITGFSGVGLKNGLWGNHKNLSTTLCGVGIQTGGDDGFLNSFVAFCKNGIEVKKNHCRLEDFRIEWIEEYGINMIDGHGSTIKGFIDRCGYNGIQCKSQFNVRIEGYITRCGARYRGYNYSELESADKEKSVNLFGFGMRNSYINISDNKAGYRDDNSSYSIPSRGVDLRSGDRLIANIIPGGYENKMDSTLTEGCSDSCVLTVNGKIIMGGLSNISENGEYSVDMSTIKRFRPPCAWSLSGVTGMAEGDIMYEYSTHTLYFYNGTEWKLISTLN